MPYAADMPMLVLLNGPPASGKSTIARRLATTRPLSLCLDVDVVRGLLGGWIESPTEAGLAARELAIEMARAHLRAGHDVVVPQFVGRAEFVEQLERTAAESDATFVELALVLERDVARRAFEERSAAPTDEVHRDAIALVERSVSPDPLGDMFDRFVELVAQRPNTRCVDVTWGDIDATVERVERVLPTDRVPPALK